MWAACRNLTWKTKTHTATTARPIMHIQELQNVYQLLQEQEPALHLSYTLCIHTYDSSCLVLQVFDSTGISFPPGAGSGRQLISGPARHLSLQCWLKNAHVCSWLPLTTFHIPKCSDSSLRHFVVLCFMRKKIFFKVLMKYLYCLWHLCDILCLLVSPSFIRVPNWPSSYMVTEPSLHRN